MTMNKGPRNWCGMVSVKKWSSTNKCNVVKGCSEKAQYSLFGEDLIPSMSRLCFTSCEKHVGLGVGLQSQGEEIIATIPKIVKDAETATKLIQQAFNMIEKGIKIERESMDKIITLLQSKPREK